MRFAFFLLPVWLLGLTLPSALAGQEIPGRLAGGLSPSPLDRVYSPGSCAKFQLLPCDDEPDSWAAHVTVAAAGDADYDDAYAAATQPELIAAKERRRGLLTALVVAADLAVTAAKATLTYDHVPFTVDHEGYFGADTGLGGADKASHFVDYYIVSKEFTRLFQRLGYSENAARWWAFGTAVAGGVVNEVADGFTKYGFSPEDIVMDVLGAGAAVLVGATHTHDIVGFRTSHFGAYEHDVYSMDLKLAGVARRMGVDIGPLRFLYFSLTYGVKGYPNGTSAEKERLVGLEIGLNLEEILDAAGIRRDTWWGVTLHVIADNVRFPFTAVGYRYDLNHSKWHGPTSGNYP